MIQRRKPLNLDVSYAWGSSISGAVGLWGGGIGGSISDAFQDRMGRVMQRLSGGDKAMPVVTVGWNSERYQGRNLALKLDTVASHMHRLRQKIERDPTRPPSC